MAETIANGESGRSVRDKLNAAMGVAIPLTNFGSVGQGGDDAAVLNSALGTAGRRIFVPDGTYIIGSAITPAANTMLFGSKRGATIQRAASSTFNMIVANSSNFQVCGLRFDGNRRNAGSNGYALYVNGTADMLFADNEVYDAAGVWSEGGTRLYVTGSYFHDGRDGVACGASAASPTTSDLFVRGNSFYNLSDEAIDINFNATNVWIEGNAIRRVSTLGDNFAEAIDVGGGTCSDIYINGNFIDQESVGFSGITIKLTTSRVFIRNNEIRNCDGSTTGYGIAISATGSDFFIEGNVVDQGARDGIAVGAAVNDNIHIRNNTVRDVEDDGIELSAAAAHVNVFIEGNTVVNGAGTGIECRGTTGLAVNGNYVTGFGASGIIVASTCANVEASQNCVTSNTGDGINVAAAAGLVTNNRTNGNSGTAIVNSGAGAVTANNVAVP